MQGAYYSWPEFRLEELWRWLMTAFGFALMVYGLVRKKIKLRDGTIVRKPLYKVLARSWFVLFGIFVIMMAISYGR